MAERQIGLVVHPSFRDEAGITHFFLFINKYFPQPVALYASVWTRLALGQVLTEALQSRVTE